MDFTSPAPASQGWGSGFRPVSPANVITEGPELVRRQADWERQIETLDQKEMELHQTQLRLIREQTASFMRDLSNLRSEVDVLKSRSDNERMGLSTSVSQLETQNLEFQEVLDRERREREVSFSQLVNKVAGLERDVPSHRDEIASLRSQVRGFENAFTPHLKDVQSALQREMEDRASAHGRMERRLGDLDDSISKHAMLHQEVDRKLAQHKLTSDQERDDAHAKLTDMIKQYGTNLEKEKRDRDFHHGSLNERLDKLEKDVSVQVSKRMSAWEEDVQELRKLIGGEATAREEHHKMIHSVVQQHLETSKAKTAQLHEASSQHHASLQERLDYIEKCLGDSADKHAEAIAQATQKLQDHAHAQQTTQEKLRASEEKLEHHASLASRVEYLEQIMGDSIDKHDAMADAHETVKDMHSKMQEQHEANHASLQERMDFVERLLGDNVQRHSEELKSAHDKLAELHGKVDKHADGHGTAIDDLQRAHADRHEIHVGMEERLKYLENVMGDSAEKHAKELEDMKLTQIKLQGNHDIHGREMDAVKQQYSKVASVEERLVYIEQQIGGHAEKHGEEISLAQGKVDQLHSRLAQLEERHQSSHSELKKAHANICSEKASLEAHHASLKERVDYLESLIGDSSDKHSKALDAAQARLDQMHGRVSTCERHGSAIDDLKKSHANLFRDKSALDAHHATLKERVDFLEGVVGDSADRHSKELEAIKTAHQKLQQESKAQHGKVSDQMTQDKEARDVLHASLQERLNYLESVMGDSADKHERHMKALEEQKALHAKLSSDVRNREANHASLAERVNYVEKLLGDSADKHAQEIAAAMAKLDSAHGRITEERMAREAHGASLEVLKKAQSNLAADKQALDRHHANVTQRLDFLEKAVGDSADQHAREVESLKAAHQKLVADGKTTNANHASASDKLAQLQREKEDLHAHHLSLGERVDYLEKLIGENAEKHVQDLENMKTSTAKQLKELDSVKKLHAHHASFEERLDYMEKCLGDSADKHAQDLAAVHTKVDQVNSKVVEERGHRESLHGNMRDQMTAEQRAREARHATIEERLKYVEQLIGDNADKHSRDLEEHKNVHNKTVGEAKALQEKHAGMTERLNYLEQVLGDSLDKHNQELMSAHAKIEQLHGRISDEKNGREVTSNTMRELLAKERDAREGHHESIGKRLDQLEELITGHADKQAAEHESHRAAHSKVVSEAKARDTHHASMEERLGYLEKTLGDSADKHAKELQEAQSKLDQVHGRLTSVERHGDHIDELKKSQAALTSQKTQLDAHHASLRERVDFLETTVGDNADKHSKALAEVRSAHTKLAHESKSKEATSVSLGDRLQYLEKVIGDSASKHAQEIQAAHAKIDAMHGRVAMVEAQSDHIDALKKAHSIMASDKAVRDEHHASMSERLDYLEKALGDSADRHAQEINLAHSKLDALHSRLGDERNAREGHFAAASDQMQREKYAREAHHASLEDRLCYLESYLGESADKHARDLQAHSGNLQHRLGQLEQKFGNELAELREHFNGEKVLRGQQSDALADHFEAERRAREAHEAAVQNHLQGHKKAIETHEKLVQDQLGHERATRDRHMEHVQALIGREKDARDKLHDHQMEHLQRETSTREAAHKDFHDMLMKERALREQHHANFQDILHNERGARQTMEDLLSQERQERSKHHETVTERVDSLQRTVGIFDSLIRKEMDERSRENRRIWDAIDNHTHDLSTQVLDVDAEKQDGEAEPRYLAQSRVIRPSSTVPAITGSPSIAWSAQSAVDSPNLLVSRVAQVTQMTRQYPSQVRSQSPGRGVVVSGPMPPAVSTMSAAPITYSAPPPTSSVVNGRGGSPARKVTNIGRAVFPTQPEG
eukprot:TRINITY_DN15541_c0_g1_i2.p1 TRINITY_DN15541_c0_g1~~TRINITY_DN15541_c0_g1_i2.p1  ORF type:complete len:1858 (-),score=462.88 TRINITY_DN15541_c0_g1_i2:61-5634(-)